LSHPKVWLAAIQRLDFKHHWYISKWQNFDRYSLVPALTKVAGIFPDENKEYRVELLP
jgi:hypothetical protein